MAEPLPRYEITKAEADTNRVADLLAVGWEPFAVVREHCVNLVVRDYHGAVDPGCDPYLTMIYFRRETPHV